MVGGMLARDVASLIARIQVSSVRSVKPGLEKRKRRRVTITLTTRGISAMPTRTAKAKWEGGLKGGRGNYSVASGLAGQYSFSSRFESGGGSTPEELIAAAHASCFSMALAAALEKNGTPSTSIETNASATLEKVGDAMSITTMQLNTVGVVPNLDDETFQR